MSMALLAVNNSREKGKTNLLEWCAQLYRPQQPPKQWQKAISVFFTIR